MKWKWFVSGSLLLLALGTVVYSQSVRRETVLWNFVNGIQIAGVGLSQDGLSLLANGESISNATDGTITLGRDDAGTVTVTAADDDATAALTILPGGAAALTLGGSSTTSVTVTADGAQDADFVVPANSVGGGEVSGVRMDLIFCGQAAENGTIYLSPAAGVNGVDLGDGVDYSISSAACDGLDGATESTQDLIIFPEVAAKVMGMYCQQAGAEALGAGETIVLSVRSGELELTPAITCTISEGQRGCRTLTGSTTDIAANATWAVKAVMTSNNTDQDLWCSVSVMLK